MTTPDLTQASSIVSILPAPLPPTKPEPNECCGTGCIPCVMDIYEEALWQYEKDLKAWNLAQIPLIAS